MTWKGLVRHHLGSPRPRRVITRVEPYPEHHLGNQFMWLPCPRTPKSKSLSRRRAKAEDSGSSPAESNNQSAYNQLSLFRKGRGGNRQGPPRKNSHSAHRGKTGGRGVSGSTNAVPSVTIPLSPVPLLITFQGV